MAVKSDSKGPSEVGHREPNRWAVLALLGTAQLMVPGRGTCLLTAGEPAYLDDNQRLTYGRRARW